MLTAVYELYQRRSTASTKEEGKSTLRQEGTAAERGDFCYPSACLKKQTNYSRNKRGLCTEMSYK